MMVLFFRALFTLYKINADFFLHLLKIEHFQSVYLTETNSLYSLRFFFYVGRIECFIFSFWFKQTTQKKEKKTGEKPICQQK